MNANDKKAELHKLTTARTKLATTKKILLSKMTPESVPLAKAWVELALLEQEINKAYTKAGGR